MLCRAPFLHENRATLRCHCRNDVIKRFPSQHSSVWLTLTVVIAKRDCLHPPRVVCCYFNRQRVTTQRVVDSTASRIQLKAWAKRVVEQGDIRNLHLPKLFCSKTIYLLHSNHQRRLTVSNQIWLEAPKCFDHWMKRKRLFLSWSLRREKHKSVVTRQ